MNSFPIWGGAYDAVLRKADFDETEHPRHPAGSDEGGQFAPKDGGEGEGLGAKLKRCDVGPVSGMVKNATGLRNPQKRGTQDLSILPRRSFCRVHALFGVVTIYPRIGLTIVTLTIGCVFFVDYFFAHIAPDFIENITIAMRRRAPITQRASAIWTITIINHFVLLLRKDAERFALPACGRAWILLGSRKNLKPEKCLKMPQNPQRQVHALLGGVIV